MKKTKKISVSFLVLFSLALLSTSCTKWATEEQLKQLDEIKEASTSADQSIADKRKERDDLKAQVAAKEKELKELEANRDFIKKKLGKDGQ
ncbi:hypothetical protein IT568_01745 [bacterium]|nr:hypothetical protein [bacterium]